MSVAIASIFRNSAHYLDRYAAQVAGLVGWLAGLKIDTHLILVEGDSTDNTWALLRERAYFIASTAAMVGASCRVDLLQHNHGGPVFGSVDNDIRWRNISGVCNLALEQVEEQDGRVIYVESDLIWTRETMLSLLALANAHHAVAPLSIHKQTGLFYDTWGYRRNGTRFSQYRPYHPDISLYSMMPIDSAGSCIVMDGRVARACRFDPPELGIVGFGQSMAKAGYQLWLDPSLSVFHP